VIRHAAGNDDGAADGISRAGEISVEAGLNFGGNQRFPVLGREDDVKIDLGKGLRHGREGRMGKGSRFRRRKSSVAVGWLDTLSRPVRADEWTGLRSRGFTPGFGVSPRWGTDPCSQFFCPPN